MSFGDIVLLYVLSVAVFFAIDLVWLGIISKNFYNKYLGHLLRSKVNWAPAIIFYLLFIIGILVFAVIPGLEAGSWAQTALMSALFGLFCYITYDLSNLATLKDWPVIVTLVDIIWGTTISTIIGVISYFIGLAII